MATIKMYAPNHAASQTLIGNFGTYVSGANGSAAVNANDLIGALDAGWTLFYEEVGSHRLLGYLQSANMNVTTDQPFIMLPNAGANSGQQYVPDEIIVTNASISLTTAAGGVYTAASKSGTAIVASAQAYSGLTTSTLVLRLTIAAAGLTDLQAGSAIAPILSLTTAQGAAATADFYLFGFELPPLPV